MNPLARIQASLRVAASRDRQTARPGPFLVTITPESANPYLNYAIPDDGADPTPEEIAALAAAFGDRKPRLEYVPDLAPKVEPALLAAGFLPESRTPLMVLRTLHPAPLPEGIKLVEPRTDDEVRALLTALNEAFGEGPPTDDKVRRQREKLDRGMVATLARESTTNEPVGGGLLVAPSDGLAEIGGVGVRLRFRRRGVAAAVVVGLAERALSRGVEIPFLMAATEAEARLYARVGFETVGEVLHISL